jgi:hypothetical protein
VCVCVCVCVRARARVPLRERLFHISITRSLSTQGDVVLLICPKPFPEHEFVNIPAYSGTTISENKIKPWAGNIKIR